MNDTELQLSPNVDLKTVKNQALNLKQLKYASYSQDQDIIYFLIHNYSNYEEIMWSLYKREKDYVLSQLKNLLFEISKLDSKLTWDCQIVYERYKRAYKIKHSKSIWVN